MKKYLRLFTLSALLAVSFGAPGFLSARSEEVETRAAVGNHSTNRETYYNGINAGSGTALMGQLHDLMVNTHQTYTTYSDCSNANYVYATDGNPNNANKTIEFYSQTDIDKAWGGGAQGTWNREHVWCQSLTRTDLAVKGTELWGETGGGSDLHHIRPVESGLNSTRNNSPYGIVTPHNASTAKYYEDANNANVAIGGWKEDDIFEPLDSVKGDVARIIMYLYVHYNTYSLIGGTTNGSHGLASYFGTLSITNIVNTPQGTEEAAWELLLDWHNSDGVDSLETRRNDAAAIYQGNRNPFIDRPNYADAIWGNQAITSLSVEAEITSFSTYRSLKLSEFTVEVVRNGEVEFNTGFYAQIGTGTGAGFSGRDVAWDITKPLSTDTTIKFTARYPTILGGSTYLSQEIAIDVYTPEILNLDISRSMAKTNYFTNESWNPTGLKVIAYFDDSLSEEFNDEVSWSYNPVLPNSTSITRVSVTASYGGKSAIISQDVSVTVKSYTGADIVISQAYGGGGNGGSTYKNDFIQLYNNTYSNISLDGYYVFYAAPAGNFNSGVALNGVILARSYYLIQEAAGSVGSLDLPTPDAVGTASMGQSNFKIALTNTEDVPTDTSSPNVVDFVGAGTANAYEGDAAPAPSNSTESISRTITNGIAIDTNNNKNDFKKTTAAPHNGAISVATRINAYPGGDISTPECESKYYTIKYQVIALTTGSLSYFKNSSDSIVDSARARYLAWANANGDANPYQDIQGLKLNNSVYQNKMVILFLVLGGGLTVTFAYFFIRKKKQYDR